MSFSPIVYGSLFPMVSIPFSMVAPKETKRNVSITHMVRHIFIIPEERLSFFILLSVCCSTILGNFQFALKNQNSSVAYITTFHKCILCIFNEMQKISNFLIKKDVFVVEWA